MRVSDNRHIVGEKVTNDLRELLPATNQAAVKMSVIKFESLGWEVDRVGSVGGVKLQMSGGR